MGDEGSPSPTVIMIVEDDAALRELICEMLTVAGYAVIACPTADSAVGRMEESSQLALLFTDIELPGDMDGVALARRLAHRAPAVPILVTSGRRLPEPDELPPSASFISKPYSPKALRRHLSEVLGIYPH